MHLTIAYDLTPKRRTTRTAIVMDHFGIDFETGRHIVADNLELPIATGDVVLFTGPSGAGKSSLLRATAAHVETSPPQASPPQASPRRQSGDNSSAVKTDSPAPKQNSSTDQPINSSTHEPRIPRLTSGARPNVIDIDALELPDRALIDAIGLPLADALRLLSQCGLGEARLLLRTPVELSDGQRYRFRLALAVAQTFSPLPREPRPDTHQRDRGRGVGGEGADDSTQRSTGFQPVRENDVPRTSGLETRTTDALRPHTWILADEFTATLDRTLAKVVASNVRRLADSTGIGFLLATTHEDIAPDLAPDVHVRCGLDGEITVERQSSTGFQPVREASTNQTHGLETRATDARRISFFDELAITAGTKTDWQRFARWHYRSHNLGFVRQVKLLWHGDEPIGICVFVSPPTSLKARNRYFGRSGQWSRASLQALNRQLLMLSRVVLHPTYRGAGIAAWFVRQCCEQSGYPWIETLAQMGHIHPLFEQAGFVRVGSSSPPRRRTRAQHSALYGNPVTPQTWRKSQHASPVYYVFDNRDQARPTREASPRRQSGDTGNPDASDETRDPGCTPTPPLSLRERDSPGAQRPGQGEDDEPAANVKPPDHAERAARTIKGRGTNSACRPTVPLPRRERDRPGSAATRSG